MKNTSKKQPALPPLPRPWRRAMQRLDHALEQNAPADYSEKIDLLGRQLFGHLWKPRDPASDKND